MAEKIPMITPASPGNSEEIPPSFPTPPETSTTPPLPEGSVKKEKLSNQIHHYSKAITGAIVRMSASITGAKGFYDVPAYFYQRTRLYGNVAGFIKTGDGLGGAVTRLAEGRSLVLGAEQRIDELNKNKVGLMNPLRERQDFKNLQDKIDALEAKVVNLDNLDELPKILKELNKSKWKQEKLVKTFTKDKKYQKEIQNIDHEITRLQTRRQLIADRKAIEKRGDTKSEEYVEYENKYKNATHDIEIVRKRLIGAIEERKKYPSGSEEYLTQDTLIEKYTAEIDRYIAIRIECKKEMKHLRKSGNHEKKEYQSINQALGRPVREAIIDVNKRLSLTKGGDRHQREEVIRYKKYKQELKTAQENSDSATEAKILNDPYYQQLKKEFAVRDKMAEILRQQRTRGIADQKEAKEKVDHVLDTYTTQKVDGITAFKEGLRSALIATGTYPAAALSSLLLDGVSFRQTIQQEYAQRKDEFAVKLRKEAEASGGTMTYNEELLETKFTEAVQAGKEFKYNEAILAQRFAGAVADNLNKIIGVNIDGNKSQGRVWLDRVTSGAKFLRVGAIAAGLSFNTDAYAKGLSFDELKALRLDQIGENFVEHTDRLLRVVTSLPDATTSFLFGGEARAQELPSIPHGEDGVSLSDIKGGDGSYESGVVASDTVVGEDSSFQKFQADVLAEDQVPSPELSTSEQVKQVNPESAVQQLQNRGIDQGQPLPSASRSAILDHDAPLDSNDSTAPGVGSVRSLQIEAVAESVNSDNAESSVSADQTEPVDSGVTNGSSPRLDEAESVAPDPATESVVPDPIPEQPNTDVIQFDESGALSFSHSIQSVIREVANSSGLSEVKLTAVIADKIWDSYSGSEEIEKLTPRQVEQVIAEASAELGVDSGSLVDKFYTHELTENQVPSPELSTSEQVKQVRPGSEVHKFIVNGITQGEPLPSASRSGIPEPTALVDSSDSTAPVVDSLQGIQTAAQSRGVSLPKESEQLESPPVEQIVPNIQGDTEAILGEGGNQNGENITPEAVDTPPVSTDNRSSTDAPETKTVFDSKVASLLKELHDTPHYEVNHGDNIWNIIRNKLNHHQLFHELEPGQRDYVIDLLKDKVYKMSADDLETFGIKSGEANDIVVGENLNFQKIITEDSLKEAFAEAEELPPAQIDSIENYRHSPNIQLTTKESPVDVSPSTGVPASAPGATAPIEKPSSGTSPVSFTEKSTGEAVREGVENRVSTNNLVSKETVFSEAVLSKEAFNQVQMQVRQIFPRTVWGTESKDWGGLKGVPATLVLTKGEFGFWSGKPNTEYGILEQQHGTYSEKAVDKIKPLMLKLQAFSGLEPKENQTVESYLKEAIKKGIALTSERIGRLPMPNEDLVTYLQKGPYGKK